ncbi:MAG: hypothetical protein WA210_15690 [Burkholderiaceae bacterium]
MKALSTSGTRGSAGAVETVAMTGRAVSAATGVDWPSRNDAATARQARDGHPGQRRREEREFDEQRRALAALVLGVFEARSESRAGEPGRSSAPASRQVSIGAPLSSRDLQIEQAIVEFMYALFEALDQFDAAEPTSIDRRHGARPDSAAAGGRSAFGERVDRLARRIAVAWPGPASDEGLPAAASLSPSPLSRLARAHAGVLSAIHSDGVFPAPASDPRIDLSALLRRLANALHVAPTLGYAAAGTAGALLRVLA